MAVGEVGAPHRTLANIFQQAEAIQRRGGRRHVGDGTGRWRHARLGFKYDDPNAGLTQFQRGEKSNGATADYNDSI
jgi:hypothetical protein